jgi:uncharacterized membrane protein SirB2
MLQTLTTIHLITVAITLSGFLLRGIWMLQDSANLKRPIVRILPHVNDTILLVSAVWAGALINQYPFFNSWLTAKLMGTLVYIVFGAIALTYGRTRTQRVVAFAAALVAFAYIVSVSVCRSSIACF